MHNQPSPTEIFRTRVIVAVLLPLLALLGFYFGSTVVPSAQAAMGFEPPPTMGFRAASTMHNDVMGVIFMVPGIFALFRMLHIAAIAAGYSLLQVLGLQTYALKRPGLKKASVKASQQREAELPADFAWSAPLTLRFALLWCLVVGPMLYYLARFINQL